MGTIVWAIIKQDIYTYTHMTKKLLFRTKLRPASKEKASSIQDALHDLAGASDEEVREVVNKYVTHEDEALLVLLMSNYKRHLSKESTNLILKRATEELTEENLLWSPLTDNLSYNFRWPYLIDSTSEDTNTLSLIKEEDALKKVEEWVHQQSDPSAFDPLFNFKSSKLLGTLAANAPVLREDQVDSLLGRKMKGELSKNLNISKKFTHKMALAHMQDLRDKHGSSKADKNLISLTSQIEGPLPEDIYRRLLSLYKLPKQEYQARASVEAFLSKDPHTPNPVLFELLTAAFEARGGYGYSGQPLQKSILLHPNVDERFWHDARDFAEEDNTFWTALLQDSSVKLAPWQSNFIYDSLARPVVADSKDRSKKSDPLTWSSYFIKRSDTPPEVLLRVAETDSRPTTRKLLSSQQKAVSYPPIARILVTSQITDVREDLFNSMHTPNDVFNTLFEEYMDSDPSHARQVFIKRMRENPVVVERGELLAPFLASEDSEIRRMALFAAGSKLPGVSPLPQDATRVSSISSRKR